MSRRRSGRLTLDNFTGGINLRDDPVDLAVNESQSAQDFVPYGEGGAIIQRGGDESFATLGTDSISAVYTRRAYHFESLGMFLVAGDQRIETVTEAGVVTVVFSGMALDSWQYFGVCQAPVSGGQGPVYMRRAGVMSYTAGGAGAAWTASAGTLPTAGRHLLYAGGRVWIATPSSPGASITGADDSRLWWSEIGDPRNWPAANTMQLDPGDGDQFTGFSDYADIIVIFKPNKAWVIYDLDTGANRRLGVDVGAIDRDTICKTPLGLFFIDPGRGPMVTDGYTTKPLENGTKAPWTRFYQAHYANDHIYCVHLDTDATTRRIWDYDIKTKSWWRHVFAADWVASYVRDADNTTWIYATRRSGSAGALYRILKEGVYTYDSGSTLVPTWRTSPHDLGANENKRLVRAAMRGSGVATLGLSREIGGSYSALGGKSLASGLAEWPTLGIARSPSFEIGKSSGDSLRLDMLSVDYSLRQR